MKTLGLIGGIAPASTIEYYRMLIAAYQARRPDGSQPLVIINSIDLQTMIGLIAADALDEVTTYLSAEVEKLARAGAEVALFASNTPHIVFDALQRQSRIPLVSIIDATFAVARSMGLTRAGLLGTRFTMQGTAYSRTFTRGNRRWAISSSTGCAPCGPMRTWRSGTAARSVRGCRLAC